MSNTIHFSGRIAEQPELRGDAKVCRFRLIRNEHAGTDQDGNKKERTVGLPFTAFGSMGETIVKFGRKGDQLFVTARIENNNYTDGENRDRYDYNFIVTEFELGAPGPLTRAAMAAAAEQR